MFFAEAQIRVHLYGQPTDMAKSYDGLQALARHAMGRDPLDGALYIFVNNAAADAPDAPNRATEKSRCEEDDKLISPEENLDVQTAEIKR
jgi:hypothetical protein